MDLLNIYLQSVGISKEMCICYKAQVKIELHLHGVSNIRECVKYCETGISTCGNLDFTVFFLKIQHLYYKYKNRSKKCDINGEFFRISHQICHTK